MRKKQQTTEHEDSPDHIILHHTPFGSFFGVICSTGSTGSTGMCSTGSTGCAQLVEHGASNAKIMGSIPRESKS